MDVEKSQIPLLHFSALWDCPNPHFSSDIRLFQYTSTNDFFNTFRIFDVISEVKRDFEFLTLYPNYIAFSQRGGAGSKKSATICPSTIFPNLWSAFRARKAHFGYFETFLWVFHKKQSWAYETSKRFITWCAKNSSLKLPMSLRYFEISLCSSHNLFVVHFSCNA